MKFITSDCHSASSNTHLDRVVVEVRHNDFIVAVDGSKVGTLKPRQEVRVQPRWESFIEVRNGKSARKGVKSCDAIRIKVYLEQQDV